MEPIADAATLHELIARQPPGWSLEQPFYTDAAIYQFERRGWLAEQWYLLAHCSEVHEPGAFIVRELLGESLILARDTEGTLRAFYNVCRHRGSRICDGDGRAPRGLTCPYHAWSYHLDGRLRKAPALQEGIDVEQLGLRPAPVREIGGIILASLIGDSASLDAVQREFEPGLRYLGIPEARIAARRSYPTQGNWKLVIENFLECYHCFPSHPEFCSVMRFVDVQGRVPADGGEAWRQAVKTWFREVADPDSPVPLREESSTALYRAGRAPIGGSRKTQSQDGEPVAPLMGRQRRFDGGWSTFNFEPFIYVSALNDHAVLIQFLPSGPQSTDVIFTWLVDDSAHDADIDVERMIWLWDVTTVQDKTIIERNALGIRSRAYAPGPYSTLESWTARFVVRYLKEMSAAEQTSILPKIKS